MDKPAGVTSHDVVDQARRRFGERRIGHSGTLDPPATGVLLVGVGSVTRLLRFLTDLGKTYRAEIVLGSTTTTLDDTGEVTATFPMDGVTLDDVRRAAAALTGEIEQVPPMVSAVQVGGRRLHELARQGVEVERAARRVTVHRFTVEPTADPLVFSAKVACSSGTYVRSLADDLGRLLGGGAHLRHLRRTAIGSFTEAEAAPVESAPLLAPPVALRDYAAVTVDHPTAERVRHGAVLDAAGWPGAGPWAVLAADGTLLAVYEERGRSDGTAKPAVVLAGG